MREIVAAYLQIAPDRVEIRADERGKPQLAGRVLEFNLSYSGELALVAVARVPVGVDVDQVEKIDDELPELVEFVLSERECAQLIASGAKTRSGVVGAGFRAGSVGSPVSGGLCLCRCSTSSSVGCWRC